MDCLYISYDGALEPLGQSQIIPYLKGLSYKNKDLRFILLTFDKKSYSDKTIAKKFNEDLLNANIEWHSLRYHKRPTILSTVFDIIQGFLLSAIIVIKRSVCIVHARGYTPALIALLLKKIFRTKFIFDMRGFWPDQKVESKHWKKGVLYYSTKYFEKKFISNADEIIVLTKQAKRVIDNYGYKIYANISVIPCCVDVKNFKLDNNKHLLLKEKNNLQGKLVFAHTGSFETGYLKDEIFNYFKVIREVFSNAHFLIISHHSRSELLNLITEKQLRHEDFTIISSSFEQMPEHLSIVDIGMLFLSLGFSAQGCSPTKFAEFLSCGIPVISTSRIGDVEDYIASNKVGVIVNSFNSEEYRRSLSELLKLLGDNELKLRCRQLAEKEFSSNVGINKYYTIYTRLKK